MKVSLTLKELAALEAYATSNGKTADAVLSEAATATVKDFAKASGAK